MAETVVLRWHWRTRSSKWALLSYRLFVHRGDFSRECGSSAPLKQLPWNWMECFMCCLVSLMPGLPPWARQQHLSLSFPLTKCPRISVDYKNKPHKPISPQSPNTHIILVMFYIRQLSYCCITPVFFKCFYFLHWNPFFCAAGWAQKGFESGYYQISVKAQNEFQAKSWFLSLRIMPRNTH